MYSSTLAEVSSKHELQIMGFTNDHSLYNAFLPSTVHEMETFNNMSACLEDVHRWMKENKLMMNTEKTGVITFGSRQQLKKLMKPSQRVIDTDVPLQQTLKYLGAELDNH